jgi:hypothetical protein
MSIRYSDKPQVFYGEQPAPKDWRQRYPQAQPIETAPQYGNSALWIFEPSGKYHRAMFHRGQWMKLEPQKDFYTGQTKMRMSGEAVANPTHWCSS